MIREVTMYQAVCDRCGRPCAETGGIMPWVATASTLTITTTLKTRQNESVRNNTA